MVKVYVVTSNQPDNLWPQSIWSTRELAQAECDRANATPGADRYGIDEHDLDPGAR